jgi:hypothetical protein
MEYTCKPDCPIQTHICQYVYFDNGSDEYYCDHPDNEFDGLCSCEACPLLNKTFETNVFHTCIKVDE